jgi:hypothetical protein
MGRVLADLSGSLRNRADKRVMKTTFSLTAGVSRALSCDFWGRVGGWRVRYGKGVSKKVQ